MCHYPIIKVLLIVGLAAVVFGLLMAIIAVLSWAIAIIRRIWVETGDNWEEIL